MSLGIQPPAELVHAPPHVGTAALLDVRALLLGTFAVGLLVSITLAQIALAALALRLGYRLVTGQARLGRWPLAVPVAAWAVTSLAAGLMAAHPLASLTVAVKGLVLIAGLYVVLDAMRDTSSVEGFAAALLALTGLVSIVAIVQVVFCPQLAALTSMPVIGRVANKCHRAHGFYSIYMTLAGVLTLVLLATAPRLLQFGGPWRRRLAQGVVWATGGVALALTQTRGAWLALLAGVLVLLVLLRRGHIALGIGLVTIIVGVLLLPGVRTRAASIVDPRDPTATERVAMWRSAVRIARDHPLTGVGPGQLKHEYLRYAAEPFRRPRGHVHNTPLQILVERGIPGLLAWAGLFAAFLWRAAAILRSAPPGPSAALVAGSIAAITGFLVGGLTEYNFGDSEVVLLAYTIMAFPFAVARRTATGSGAPSPPASAVAGGAAV